ncbi:cation:proton antiporter [Vallitalea okinawensis]|uniref:cation:proton antiporter n=1 Tax=Vallitalea okinawensis TaxID=2078660 RepID=UPI000CFE1A24|nr:cation:proton antiporter [Vallitalea okinawensis]
MATSLALILLLGLFASVLFRKMRLPGLLGMLLLGIVLGPYVLDVIDPALRNISEDLRLIALIVILLRAGLGLSRGELKQVGKTAAKMSCIPGILEGFTIVVLAIWMLDFSFIEGGMLGFIIAAVSPAVVVPFMLVFNEKRIGTNKGIPTLILASASIDDVFAITIFSTFLGLYGGEQVDIGMKLLGIPVSIIAGLFIGVILGIILVKVFDRYHIRDTKKVLIVLASAILIITIEDLLEGKLPIAGLLGVMAIGFMILELKPVLARRLSDKFNRVWVLAEIILFVMVGAEVNISVALDAGLVGLGIIAIGLVARSIGVFISTMNTDLNMKERIFCMIAYTPKATVQAAIGSIPLAAGVESGEVILAIAVMSILITAPLGAIGIKLGSHKLVDQEAEKSCSEG